VLIELRAAAPAGWTVLNAPSDASAASEVPLVELEAPDSAQFDNSVWHLMRSVAYDQFVSLERVVVTPKTYLMCTRSKNGLRFQVRFTAR
jgi:hypothetical protein